MTNIYIKTDCKAFSVLIVPEFGASWRSFHDGKYFINYFCGIQCTFLSRLLLSIIEMCYYINQIWPYGILMEQKQLKHSNCFYRRLPSFWQVLHSGSGQWTASSPITVDWQPLASEALLHRKIMNGGWRAADWLSRPANFSPAQRIQDPRIWCLYQANFEKSDMKHVWKCFRSSTRLPVSVGDDDLRLVAASHFTANVS